MLRCTRWLRKGDFAAVFFHDNNPQNGAPYNEHDRKLRDDELDDFMKSVKGWRRLDNGAITRSFRFDKRAYAYEWMGRVLGFTYLSEKYPKITWQGNAVDVVIYSARFHGLSVKEARVAAFMNDQAFLIKKADAQSAILSEKAAGSIAAWQRQQETLGAAAAPTPMP